MPSIVTRYLSATASHGARIKAKSAGGNTLTVSYQYNLNDRDNHMMAACALAKDLGWEGTLAQGVTDRDYVHILVESAFKKKIRP
jgi:hypothetical protein